MPTRVVACVIERDGKLLLCRRPAHKRHGGLWEFPGGKLEDGEQVLDAAARELSEELGIGVKRVGPIQQSFSDAGSEFVIEFVHVEIQGEPRACEHDELRWLKPMDALGLTLAPTDRRYLEALLGRFSSPP